MTLGEFRELTSGLPDNAEVLIEWKNFESDQSYSLPSKARVSLSRVLKDKKVIRHDAIIVSSVIDNEGDMPF